MELTERQRRLKEAFVEARGYWTDSWERLLELDSDFFEVYFELSAVPWRNGSLDPKVKEFVYIAVDGATTHLYEPGIRVHIRNDDHYCGNILHPLGLASCVRVSVCHYNSLDEVCRFLTAMEAAVSKASG